MENIKDIIAKNLVQLRKSHRLTQQELAEKLNYSDKAISRWEHGQTLPDIETLSRVCELYGVKFEYLLQKEQLPKDKNPYVIKTNAANKIVIVLLAIFSVWLLATVVFVYFNIFLSYNVWNIFIWALPVSGFIASVFNRWWGTKKLSYIISSFNMWTLILSIYLQILKYNFWLLFIVGVPIQAMIILFAIFKQTRKM